MSWEQVSIDLPEIDVAEKLLDGAGDAVTAVQVVVSALQPVLSLLGGTITPSDVAGGAVLALLDQAESALDLLKINGRLAALPVPLLTPASTDNLYLDVEVAALRDIPAAVSLRRAGDEASAGGNFGIYKAVAESLFDSGDLNRPDPGDDDWISTTVLVYGSTDPALAVQQSLQLDSLFGELSPVPFDRYIVPTPQTLRATTAQVSSYVPDGLEEVFVGDDADQKLATVVRWDARPTASTPVRLPELVLTITGWNLYLKRGSAIESGEDLSSYLVHSASVDLVGAPSIGEFYAGTPEGVVLRELDANTNYYVSVGYIIELTNTQTGAVTDIEPTLRTNSEQVRVRMSQRPPPRDFSRGVPPDWIGTGAGLQSIPPVAQLTRTLEADLAILRAGFTSQPPALSALQSRYDSKLSALQEIIDRVRALLGQLSVIFSALSAGIWATTGIHKGGRPAILEFVGSALLDRGVENQPPFQRGDAYTGAIVLVASGTSRAQVEAASAPILALLRVPGDPDSDAGAAFSAMNDSTAITVSVDTPQDDDWSIHDLGVTDEPC